MHRKRWKRRRERVVELVAVSVEADNTGDGLDMAGAASPGNEDDDIHRLGDQRTRRRQSDFEDQLFQAQQCAVGGNWRGSWRYHRGGQCPRP